MTHMSPPLSRRLVVANTVVFVGVIVLNALSATGNLGDVTTGELSDEFPTPITPDGYAFSIWSVIYLFLAGFIIIQVYACLKKSRVADFIVLRVSYCWIVSGVANCGWTLAWQLGLRSSAWPSLVFMAFILVANLVAYFRLASTAAEVQKLTWAEYFLGHVPFALYTAWIVGASLLNMMIAFGCNAKTYLDDSWVLVGIAGLILDFLVALFVLYSKEDVWFAGVAVWTLIAIAQKHPGAVRTAALVNTIQLAVLCFFVLSSKLWSTIMNRRDQKVPSGTDLEEGENKLEESKQGSMVVAETA